VWVPQFEVNKCRGEHRPAHALSLSSAPDAQPRGLCRRSLQRYSVAWGCGARRWTRLRHEVADAHADPAKAATRRRVVLQQSSPTRVAPCVRLERDARDWASRCLRRRACRERFYSPSERVKHHLGTTVTLLAMSVCFTNALSHPATECAFDIYFSILRADLQRGTDVALKPTLGA
jgi:hypothetical protein